MSTQNVFGNFKSKAPEFQQLGAGANQPVRINRYVVTDSRHNFDGSEKESLPEYADSTPQVAVVFVSTTGKGVITNRYNMLGFKRYNELSAAQIKSGKFIEIDEYACMKQKDGSVVRIEDEKRTEQALSILSNLFHALGLPEGSGQEELDDAIENGTVLAIDVTTEEYEGKTQYIVKRTKKLSGAVMSESREALEM